MPSDEIARMLNEAASNFLSLRGGDADHAVKGLPEDMQALGKTVFKTGQMVAELADSLRNIGELLARSGMKPELIRPLLLVTFDGAIERMNSLRAAITVTEENTPS